LSILVILSCILVAYVLGAGTAVAVMPDDRDLDDE
jgi:hypothetical protein